MPRNRIPRRAGRRDWRRLSTNERLVLGAVYRVSGRTFGEISSATGLSAAQVRDALDTLTEPLRGHRLGCRGAVLARHTRDDGGYVVTPEWEDTGHAPRPAPAGPSTVR